MPFDELYETLIVQPSADYRAHIGPPVHLDPEAFKQFLIRLKDFRTTYPNMAFWQIVDFKNLSISHSDGYLDVFGRNLFTVKDFYRIIHQDYLLPYLRWRGAAYDLIFSKTFQIDSLAVSFRLPLPLQVAGSEFHWFNMNSTIVQVDREGRLVSNLQTFYREGKWSARNLRPMEASLDVKDIALKDLEGRLISQLSLQLIDEFTDAELDVLSLYAKEKSAEEVLAAKGWTRNTLHEYNANLLRKAKKLFVYDFRNARDFAEYCLEKGFIQLR